MALVVLVMVSLRVVIALVTAVAYLRSDFAGGPPGLAGVISYRASDPVLVVTLTALVASCVLDGPTPRARGLASAALVVAGVSVTVALVFALIGLNPGDAVGVVNTLDQLVVLAVPVLAMVALARLRQLVPASVAGGEARSISTGAQPAMPQPPAPTPIDEQYQPSWLPDTAAGAAWQRAGDAAAGAPASGWGTPGQGGGWQVEPGTPSQPGPPVGGWHPDPDPDQGRRDAQQPPHNDRDRPPA